LPVKAPRTSWSLLALSSDQRKQKELTMLRLTITSGLIALAAAGGVIAIAPAAQADTGVADNGVRGASVRATADEAPRARGSIAFRSERYQLSDRAVVSTTPTTIRIRDDSATTKEGARTSLYIQLGYTLDPPNWSDATHVWGHLNSPTERGIDLDVHGVHLGNPT
jgi:hypothetical protein